MVDEGPLIRQGKMSQVGLNRRQGSLKDKIDHLDIACCACVERSFELNLPRFPSSNEASCRVRRENSRGP